MREFLVALALLLLTPTISSAQTPTPTPMSAYVPFDSAVWLANVETTWAAAVPFLVFIFACGLARRVLHVLGGTMK